MREIKFRAWIIQQKRMFDVLQISFDDQEVTEERSDSWEEGFSVEKHHKLSEVILMQFTGLKDKNGKEIYEGDVVKADFCDALEVKIPDIFYDEESDITAYKFDRDFEVIGNIYENHELLEPKAPEPLSNCTLAEGDVHCRNPKHKGRRCNP